MIQIADMSTKWMMLLIWINSFRLSLAKQLKDHKAIAANCKGLIDLYTEMNRYKDAMQYYKILVEEQDKLFRTKANTKINVLTDQANKAEKVAKEKEAELTEADKELTKSHRRQRQLMKEGKLSKEETERLRADSIEQEQKLKEKEELIAAKNKVLEQNQRIIQQSQQINILLGGIVLVVLVSLISLFRSFRQKKKANRILAEQNEKINTQNSEIMEQRDKLTLANQQLEKANRDVKAQRDEMVQLNSNLGKANRQVTQQRDKVLVLNKELEKQRDEILRNNKALKKQKEEILEKNGILQQQKEEIQTQTEQLLISNKRLERANGEITSQRDFLAKLNNRLEKQSEEIKGKNNQLREQKKEILERRNELQESLLLTMRQKKEISETLAKLRKTQSQLVEAEKMASLGNLVAGVAHEINTPVGIGVHGSSSIENRTRKFAELFKSGSLSPNDLQKYLEYIFKTNKLILSNLKRTADLVKSFKQVSVDQSKEEKRKFKLKEYLQDVINTLHPKFKYRQIGVAILCDETLEIDSYPGVFAQVFTNFAMNSLIHAYDEKDEGKIRIIASLEGDRQVKLIYKDDGKGMSTTTISKIFDPFFTTNKQTGTGLGMHIVYNLITQKLNGHISVKSQPNEGVEFTLLIPKE